MSVKPSIPCQQNPEFWFPDGHRGTAARSQQVAAALICRAQCPLARRVACLSIAMDAEGDAAPENRFGVYGGLTPRDRHRLNHLRKQELAA